MSIVTLYYNDSDNKTLGKNLKLLANVTIVLKKDTSELNPTIILNASENILKANYMYINAFERYYFISGKKALTADRYEISGDIDVLQSYESDIRSLLVIADKQEVQANMYINDGSFVTEDRTFNTIINFENGFNNNGEFILITAGG